MKNIIAGLLLVAGTVAAQAQDADPAMVEAAKAEGRVVLYAPIDAPAMRPLIDDFQSLYPGVTLEFTDMQTTVLYNRFLSEMAAGAASADIVWNTPMDLQFKLVQDGYAQPYKVREHEKLPAWADWEDTLYAVTLDPAVWVYSKAEIEGDLVPETHADLVRILTENPGAFEGRIVSYDIEKAAGGFMMAVQDSKHFADFWTIPQLFGKVSAQFPSGSGFMIETVGSGENVFGYNQLGSAAAKGAAGNDNLGTVYPKDFVVVMARTAFISKAAQHPNAAKLLLDYLLSTRAQQIIVDNKIAYALRPEVEGDLTLSALTAEVGEAAIKPVTIGPELAEMLEPAWRTDFLGKWQAALRGELQP